MNSLFVLRKHPEGHKAVCRIWKNLIILEAADCSTIKKKSHNDNLLVPSGVDENGYQPTTIPEDIWLSNCINIFSYLIRLQTYHQGLGRPSIYSIPVQDSLDCHDFQLQRHDRPVQQRLGQHSVPSVVGGRLSLW